MSWLSVFRVAPSPLMVALEEARAQRDIAAMERDAAKVQEAFAIERSRDADKRRLLTYQNLTTVPAERDQLRADVERLTRERNEYATRLRSVAHVVRRIGASDHPQHCGPQADEESDQ